MVEVLTGPERDELGSATVLDTATSRRALTQGRQIDAV
jgi:hypothetical protein